MNNLCKECKHYRDGGVCVSSKNRKGYTSALDSSRNCWEAPDPLDGNDSVFSQQAPGPAKEVTEVPTKKCKICGKVLPLSEFPFHPKSKDGHTATCSYCHAESVRAGQASSEKVAAKRRKKELEKVAKEHEQKPTARLDEYVEQQVRLSIEDLPDSIIIAEMRRRQLPGCISLFSDEALGEELKRRGYVPLFEKGQPIPVDGIVVSEEQQLWFKETYGNLVSALVDEELDEGDQKKINRLLGGISILQGVAGLLNIKIK